MIVRRRKARKTVTNCGRVEDGRGSLRLCQWPLPCSSNRTWNYELRELPNYAGVTTRLRRRLIASRNASSPSGRPINSLPSSASRIEEIGEVRSAVDERLHAHEPVVAAPGRPHGICLPEGLQSAQLRHTQRNPQCPLHVGCSRPLRANTRHSSSAWRTG